MVTSRESCKQQLPTKTDEVSEKPRHPLSVETQTKCSKIAPNKVPPVAFLPSPPNSTRILFTLAILLITLAPRSEAGTYKESVSIFKTLLLNAEYNTEVRPLLDQSRTLDVYTLFELLSIVEVNDVVQSFTCNGFLWMGWFDEMLPWNETKYGGISSISPKAKDIFRPHMTLLNTMGDRDVFGDDYSPVTVQSSGFVSWVPGSIFPVSCKLDLTNYPFDEQSCHIDMLLMNFNARGVKFVSLRESVGLLFYSENGEWEINYTNVTGEVRNISDSPTSALVVSFNVKRKPQFLVLSILLPIVFLSLLNLLVFVIPVDSGEKISFGITVLLALSVFMSIISGMLPRSAESMPKMIRYIFSLLIISVLTVVDSIIIVRLHHMDEKEQKENRPEKEDDSHKPLSAPPITKISYPSRRLPPVHHLMRYPEERQSPSVSSSSTTKTESKTSRYKLISKHIDLISLIVFGVVWLAFTVQFIVEVAA